MSVREPWPLVPCVPQALMTAPPQTANDREGRWHRSKLKAQHCVRSPLVLFIFLWETAPHLAPSASLLPHLLAHFDHQSGARSVFIGGITTNEHEVQSRHTSGLRCLHLVMADVVSSFEGRRASRAVVTVECFPGIRTLSLSCSLGWQVRYLCATSWSQSKNP